MRHAVHARFWSRSRFAHPMWRGLGALVLAGMVIAAAYSPPRAVVARPDGPTTDLVLTGRIRDFPDSHPDFCISSGVGNNWVEGSVASGLDAEGCPVYTGQGRRVIAPATDGAGHGISTSLIGATVPQALPAGVQLASAPTLKSGPTLDTYNPSLGSYGGSNIGPAPQIETGQIMAAVEVPSVSPDVPAAAFTGSGQSVISAGFRCGSFVVSQQHTVTIEGDVTIVATDKFVVENTSQINLAAGARLTVYALNTAAIRNYASVNMNTGDFTRMTLYKLGASDLDLENHSRLCATIVAPDASLRMRNNSDAYGTVSARSLFMQNPAGLHVAQQPSTACSGISDHPAQLGARDSAGVSSPATFAQWFRDVPGVNQGAQARLLFQKEPGRAYEFSSTDFRPIDGKLLEGGSSDANRNFTYELDGEFTYEPCTGQFFEFSGDGDAYVYVDGVLVLELSGHGTGVTQYADMDRLGLDPAKAHRLQFFYASRSCSGGPFHVSTSIELRTRYVIEFGTIAVWD